MGGSAAETPGTAKAVPGAVEDPRDAQIRALRQQESALMQAAAAVAGEDPRDVQVRVLQARVRLLTAAIGQLSSPPPPQTWIELPIGQSVPGEWATCTHEDRLRMGFRWDGNKPVFPAHWPVRAREDDLAQEPR